MSGDLTVEGGGEERKLKGGEQISTTPSLAGVPVRDDVAWSRSSGDLEELLSQISSLRADLNARVAMPGERYMPDPPATPAPGAGPVLPRWREPAVWDVFEPDGRYLGRVAKPTNIAMLRMSRNRVWGTLADDDGVQLVKRFRIDWR